MGHRYLTQWVTPAFIRPFHRMPRYFWSRAKLPIHAKPTVTPAGFWPAPTAVLPWSGARNGTGMALEGLALRFCADHLDKQVLLVSFGARGLGGVWVLGCWEGIRVAKMLLEG